MAESITTRRRRAEAAQPAADDRAWGLYATGAWQSRTPDGAPTAGWRLYYVVRGSGTLVAGRERRHIEAGEVVLMIAGGTATIRPEAKRGCLAHQVDFAGSYADQLFNAGFFAPFPAVIRAGFDEQLLGLMSEVIQLARLRPAGWTRMQSGALMHILARLEVAQRCGGSADRHARLAQDARLLLSDPERDGLALQALASELGVGYAAFRRGFRTQTGTTPHQFRLNQQLTRAQRLLHDSQLSIAAIAEELGFSSQAYFARLFRRKTGLSPSVWRANQARAK